MLKNFGNFNKPANIETEKSKSKVWLFTGHLGSGKTTLINNLLKNFSPEERENTLLIINDVGSQNIDFSRLQEQNKDMEMTAISGNGCICCGDEDSFKKVLEQIRKQEKETGITKNLIIEPSGIAEPVQMNAILKQFLFEPIVSSSLNSLILKGKTEEEIKNYVRENLGISDFVVLCNTGSYFDEETKKILESILTGKNIRILPKGSVSIEAMTGDELKNNPFVRFANDLKNTSPNKKITFSQVKEKKEQEKTISRENFPISRYKLLNLVKVFGEYLVRAKGTLSDNKEFDILFGGVIDIKRIPEIDKNSKTYNIPENKNKQFNFIFKAETPKEILKKFEEILENTEEENKDFYEKYFWSAGVPEIPKESEYNGKIQKLIYQFDEYIDMYNSEISLKEELEKIEEIKNPEEKAKEFEKLEKEFAKIKNDMAILGDDMKYDNPIIWLQYKNHAYRGTSSEIPTIGEFIKHCFKNLDYICGRRIDFFAKNLEKKFGINIYELEPNMTFDEFLETYHKELGELCQDEKFMNLWLRYEYFTIGERTAKWENYRRSKKFYELNLK